MGPRDRRRSFPTLTLTPGISGTGKPLNLNPWSACLLELETVGQREQVTRKQVEYFLSKKRKPKKTFRNQADTTK